MGLITSDRFNHLKQKVKDECNRRQHNGSVISYAGEAYDYVSAPKPDKKILKEHFVKIIEPLNAINESKVKESLQNTDGDRIISEEDFTTMETLVEFYASSSLQADTASTGCMASCTGLCVNRCTNSCRGCGATCSAACRSSCSSGNACKGSCQGCTDNCTGDCKNSCNNHCSSGNACKGTCSGSGCSGRCDGWCKATCANGCNAGTGATVLSV